VAFRSRFLFLRHSVFSGTVPLWDPYPANGQPAVNDPLYQLFHLPSLLVRLLLPEVIAYNLWIALPVPLAAWGTYLFLRRHVTPAAAALGGIAFAVSGPMVSTTNFPNMSWSVAAVPFVFWAMEMLFERRTPAATVLLAAVVSCQALAGEPVTFAATFASAAAYAMLPEGRWRDRRLVLLAAIGLAAGTLLAAIQFVPLEAASRASMRGMGQMSDIWAFHPLALVELAVPHFFGDFFNSSLREMGWMLAVNSGRDPFYYTMYLGVPIVLLAAVAACSGRPRTTFWTVVILGCAVASLGPHTPVYPLLRELIPPLRSFRYPVKYLSLAAFGVATLASMAFQWVLDRDVPGRAVRLVLSAAGSVALLLYGLIAWVLMAPRLPIGWFFHLAEWANVPFPTQGAEFLLLHARPLLVVLLLKLLCASFLLWLAASSRGERRLGLTVFAVFAVVDLLASNSSVNPTIALSVLRSPAWVDQIPPGLHERVYIGGRLEGSVKPTDVDAPKYARYLDGYTEMEQRSLVLGQFLMHPSGARIRESMSYDLPMLWSTDFARAVGWFRAMPREERLRYLQRVGTRFVILPTPPYSGARPLAAMIGAEQQHLYDFNPAARRTYVVRDVLLEPDVDRQTQAMFQARFDPLKAVLVSAPPPAAAGVPGPPVPPSATFVEDGLNRVVIRAGSPGDAYLALLDTYNPDWKVDVDGAPAPLMRANGLFRAVHLTAGEHLVTFTYRPSMFYLGAAITALTGLGLALWCGWSARRARRTQDA
jgi:Bacterial membrane protein YfhO